MTNEAKPLLHICYAPTDHAWVHGRMVRELGLQPDQYRTREDDDLGKPQLTVIRARISAALTAKRAGCEVVGSATRSGWGR